MLSFGAESLSYSLSAKNTKIKIYRTIILAVVLYGCETWSPILREEHRLRVFDNRVLGKIFRLRRDEVTGEWRKLHNEGLNDLYSLPNIVRGMKSRRMRWAWFVARMGRVEVYTRFSWGKLRETDQLEDPGVDGGINIKMDLQGVGCEGRDWIHMAQDRDRWRAPVNAIMNLRVP